MAVSKVRKLSIIAHAQCREEVLTTLRGLGSVHISDVREILPESESEFPGFLKDSIPRTEAKLAQIRHCLDFGGRFVPKPSLVERLFKGRLILTEQQVKDYVTGFELESYSEECTSIERELQENEAQIAKNETIAEDVGRWLRLDFPLELIRDTQRCRVYMGMCDARSFKPMTDEISETTPLHHIEIVDRSRTSVSIVLIYHKSEEEIISPVLREYGWHSVNFADLTGTPAEVLAGLRERMGDLRDRNHSLRETIKEDFLSCRDRLLVLYDHYSQELQTLKVQQNFLFTSRTFAISGWVLASEEEKLKHRLHELTSIVEINCSDPEPGDDVPILLKNKPVVKPFSLITELYGRPHYSEFDPTPLLFPFFVFFFGICLGDAGYGVLLAVGSLIALRVFKIQGGARKLLQILIWGGFSSFVVGLFTGGIFAIKLGELPEFFSAIMLFDPTKQVLLFLYLAFLFGLVQVLFGLGVKLAENLREGNAAGAVLDQGLWILFVLCLTPLVYKYLFGGSVSRNLLSISSKGFNVLGIALVMSEGRQQKFVARRLLRRLENRAAKIFGAPVDYLLSTLEFLVRFLGIGFLKLFRTGMDYFSDVLSYARLMALGLATAFLAMTINDIASLVLGIPYGIGMVLAIFILVFGHIFNMAINSLGAFVHTLRLQYLEFFSKFFTGGGRVFKPFTEERVYTIVQSGMEQALSDSNM